MYILLAIALVAVVLWLLRPKDKSAAPAPYFQQLSAALAHSRVTKPVLIIDKQRLIKNIDAVGHHAKAIGMDVRVAMKSLPCDPLLDTITERLGTNKMMVFSTDYLKTICLRKEYVDVLLGKPMPATAVADFYQGQAEQTYHVETIANIQWLVDNLQRLQAYAAIADKKSLRLKVNFEIDIGIHRGGFDNQAFRYVPGVGYELLATSSMLFTSIRFCASDCSWSGIHCVTWPPGARRFAMRA